MNEIKNTYYSHFINVKEKESPVVPKFLKKPNEKSPLLPPQLKNHRNSSVTSKNSSGGRIVKALSVGILFAIFLGVCFICFWVNAQSTTTVDYDGTTMILTATKDLHSNELINSTNDDNDIQIQPESSIMTTTGKDIERLKFPLVVDDNKQICRNALDLEEELKNNEQKRHLSKRALLLEPDIICIFPFNESCNANDEYRSADGSCNNLKHPNWGASERPFIRLLMPDYGDGKGDEMRIASDGSQLPGVRNMSLKIHTNQQKNDSTLSILFSVFGQYISHDMSADFAVNLRHHQDVVTKDCCLPNQQMPKTQYKDCCAIEIAKNDIFYHELNETCMSVTRGQHCTICPLDTQREQYSSATSFLDGSVSYGSNNIRQTNLREGKLGKLKISYDKNGETLPPILIFPTIQNGHEEGLAFNSGDDRIDSNLGITVMSLIWIKNHNNIATHLSNLNPNWNDEKLFQESRKICIAQLQHITFNEYVPNLLGPIILEKAELKLAKNNEYFYDYDETIDPTMSNEFSVAAHRFGHSLVQGFVPFIKNGHGQDRNTIATFTNLSKIFENPKLIYKSHEVDDLIRGQASCPGAKSGVHMPYPFTNHFFRSINENFRGNKNETIGFDLAAIDIQAGRDHGIPGYGAWRKFCGFHPIQKFSDLIGIWNPEVINHTSQMFRSVEDVDLYTAGLAEHHVPGGKVGPTFACIIGDQFQRLRKGDRFWYENKNQPKPFTKAQLNSIRKTTLARILCDNVDSLGQIQLQTLLQPSKSNKILDCKDAKIPKIDYKLWQENKKQSKFL